MTGSVDQKTEAEDARTTEQLKDRLNRLKKIDLTEATLTLWVVHRKLVNKKAQYSALKVETEESIRNKLSSAAKRHIEQGKGVKPYEYLTEDQDGCMLEQPTRTTDFNEIITLLNRNGEDFKVEQQEQLQGAWGYVIKLQLPDTAVYAFRKITGGWSSKNKDSWLFKNRVLFDLEEQAVFRADKQIDFIAFEDSVFILHKKNFETAVNFREGMERHRDEILEEFQELELVSDVSVIKAFVGKNLHELRKLASVKNNGYYNLPWYMDKLKEINDKEGWGLTIDGGTIQVNEDNVDLTLTLLSNNRLISPITDEAFDVPIKKPVSETA